MPRPISLRLVVRTLENNNFFFISQTGSHAKYRKHGNSTTNVIVPIHEKEIRHGTFRSILRQSKLKEEDFRKKKN
ncbi:type II toxin-antitoxin system HicA family toxin [Patescibacteria group bacterium]|nr:type II toxin-antitoxin system HicA family toxin [Patescibacteria group bacterium]MBU2633363.1 type II toxin-antitoxin system HicA family toxin [Patescibacteria group bacterium]